MEEKDEEEEEEEKEIFISISISFPSSSFKKKDEQEEEQARSSTAARSAAAAAGGGGAAAAAGGAAAAAALAAWTQLCRVAGRHTDRVPPPRPPAGHSNAGSCEGLLASFFGYVLILRILRLPKAREPEILYTRALAEVNSGLDLLTHSILRILSPRYRRVKERQTTNETEGGRGCLRPRPRPPD